MSKFFTKSNNESAKDLFQKKMYYWAYVSDRSLNNVVDFTFGERGLYGRVGRAFQPIVVTETALKTLSVGQTPALPPRALNFVADLFTEMSRQFQKKALLSQIATNDPNLTNLRVHKAYVSPQELYREHQQKYIKGIGEIFKSDQMYFSNFEEFVTLILPVLRTTCKSSRFTYPGFIKSTECSILSTGLAIEIAEMSYDNDEEKINQFIKSKNWDFYINTCNAYGFMVDLNNPWRIVADLQSEIMQAQARFYRYGNLDAVFSRAYENPNLIDLRKFGITMLKLYNECAVASYDKVEYCPNGQSITTKIYPERYNLATLLSGGFADMLVKIYTSLRLFEEKPEMPQPLIDSTVREVMTLFKAEVSMRPLCLYLEKIINKEFDKVGSLNYIKKATEKQREAEIMAKRESEDESHYRYANIAREQDREWQTINGAKDDGSETLVPYADLPPEDQEIWD
tara:strand:+ start:407 stop:1771 length:1365 start_codon:yes stop_codon:yes gene_type:complete